MGQSCSWPAAAPFTQGAKVTFVDFGTAAAGVGGCKALDAATPNDLGAISSYLSTMGVISSSAKGTCGGKSAQTPTTTPVPPALVSVGGKTAKAGKAAKGKNAKGKTAKAANAKGKKA
jgi:hypothetical protein